MIPNARMVAKDGQFTIVGKTGKHRELTEATIYSRETPVVSISGDMHQLTDFDGLSVINVYEEKTQLIGLYYHPAVTVLSRNRLLDLIILLVQKLLGKGRKQRKHIHALIYTRGEDGSLYVRNGDIPLFYIHQGKIIGREDVQLRDELNTALLGKNKTYLRIQCNVLLKVLYGKANGACKYKNNGKLTPKNPEFAPLLPLTE